ncbi:MAG: glycoside hydrolase family 32 protein [Corynebacterium sp.]|nr:glycoside hydrolase family 32 protein [Corynebacterium sp.]
MELSELEENVMADTHARYVSRAMLSRHDLELVLERRWLPEFHLAPPAGFLRELSGIVAFDTAIHVYYQHGPGSATRSPICWGHAVTDDFITWENRNVVLAPNERWDAQGIMGGSVMGEDDGSLVAFYSARQFSDPSHPEAGTICTQRLATSTDGDSFVKDMEIIGLDKNANLRSPKVWREGLEWYMVLGGRDPKSGHGAVWLFKAASSHGPWSRVGVLYIDPDENVQLIETPDFFELDGKWILTYTPISKKVDGLSHRNAEEAGYVVGSWAPGEEYRVRREYRTMDHGHNFSRVRSVRYEGRRIALGWMGTEYPQVSAEDNWAGILSIPRVLSLNSELELCQQPIIAADPIRYMQFDMFEENRYALVPARVYYVDIDKRRFDGDRFVMEVHAVENSCTKIIWDAALNLLSIDRGSVMFGERSVRYVPVDPNLNRVRFSVVLDICSVEVFSADGTQVLSALSFPAERSFENRIAIEGGEGRVIIST